MNKPLKTKYGVSQERRTCPPEKRANRIERIVGPVAAIQRKNLSKEETLLYPLHLKHTDRKNAGKIIYINTNPHNFKTEDNPEHRTTDSPGIFALPNAYANAVKSC